MGISVLVVCGSVNATSWRVCSKPEAGANFLSVADAVASNSVFAGDTLYIEPGHYESNMPNINKSLCIIGPGYWLNENNINTMNNEEGVFQGGILLSSGGCVIKGCSLIGALRIADGTGWTSSNANIPNCQITGCKIRMNRTSETAVRLGPNTLVENCFIIGCMELTTYSNNYGNNSANNSLIQNNIIKGHFVNDGYGAASSVTIRNNTIIDSTESYFAGGISNCEIYNNIIINTNNNYTTTTTNQVIDTFYYKDRIFDFNPELNNNIYNNIFSCLQNSSYLNCVYNMTIENVLIWNNASTIEEMYKHKANGPAVGAGVNGTTCGAYGAVNGGQAYQPAGIPKYRPYIYDANIDETPSTNNIINASFKIKVQQ